MKKVFLFFTCASLASFTLSCSDASKSSEPDVPQKTKPMTQTERSSWFDSTVQSNEVVTAKTDTAFEAQVKTNPYLGCGYDPATDGASKVLANNNYAATQSTVKGPNWTVTAESTMTVAINAATASVNTLFTVDNANPSVAITEAKNMASQYSSNVVFADAANAAVETALGKTSSDPSCGLLLAQTFKLKAVSGDTYVNITFDKPTPYLISPTLTVARINHELQSPVTISNITATIDTNDSSLSSGGTTRTGSVSLTLIDPLKTLTDSSGKSVTVKGDYAVRVTSRFDGTDTGALTWLNSVNEYFVDVATSTIVGVIVQIPRNELSTVVYAKK